MPLQLRRSAALQRLHRSRAANVRANDGAVYLLSCSHSRRLPELSKGELLMSLFHSNVFTTQSNVERNIDVVNEVGLVNYIFEVVTDKKINLPETQSQREVVVPTSYRSKSGKRHLSIGNAM